MVLGLKGRAESAAFGMPASIRAGTTKKPARTSGARGEGRRRRRCRTNAPRAALDGQAEFRKSLVGNTVARATSLWDARARPFVEDEPMESESKVGAGQLAPHSKGRVAGWEA